MTFRVIRALGVFVFAALLSGCGSSSSGPSPIPTTTLNAQSVTFTAFLDENENRALDPNEGTRIPNVEIVVGTVKGRTGVPTGQANLQIPEGSQTLEVTASSLPPFYRPPAATTFAVPATGPVMVPITLPRGSNRANVYMAFGDSITNGEPEVGDGNGYRRILQDMLRTHFGTGDVVNEGLDGTNSDRGAARIDASLSRVRPSFTLVLYGTNDWNQCHEPPSCVTIPGLRSMVRQVKSSGGHPFVGAILPVNVGYDNRTPPSRQDWVIQMNALIKQMADEEGAVYVDLYGAFARSGLSGSALYVDHLHPTEPGYRIMAQTWFDAITKAYTRILTDF